MNTNKELETRIKELEKQLAETQATHKLYIDESPNALFVCDRNGRYIDVNKSAEEMLGYSREELLTIGIPEILSEKDFSNGLVHFETLKKTGKSSGENILKKKDGSEIWVHISATELPNQKYIANCRDITKEKIAVHALARSEEFHKTLLEHIPDNIAIITKDHSISYIKQTLTGRSTEELKGEDIFKYIDPEYKSEFDEAIKKAFENRETSKLIVHAHYDSWWNVRIIPIPDENNQAQEIMLLGTNITEERKYQEQLKASIKEREILHRELQHRVKNNLAMVSSILSLAIQFKDKDPYEMLIDAKNRIMSISKIYDLLSQSAYSDKVNANVFINDLLFNIFYTLKSEYKDITLVRSQKEINEIKLDTNKAIPLGIIINEIMSNSMKYAFIEQDHGKIETNLEINDSELELTIKDNGIGIKEQFNPEQKKTLGTTIIYALIQQISGSISIASNHGTEYLIKMKY